MTNEDTVSWGRGLPARIMAGEPASGGAEGDQGLGEGEQGNVKGVNALVLVLVYATCCPQGRRWAG
jgi:hypothetical protein